MPLLEPQFLDGRDRIESRIRLEAHWLDGWKHKDGKWKFEEEVHLPHVDPAYFRCRIHLFGGWTQEFANEAIRSRADEIQCVHDLDGVRFAFLKDRLFVVAPLNLEWTKTNNPSKNPCLARDSGQQGLPLDPIGNFTFQLLITYRNLDKLLRSEKMFAEEQHGFRWVGSPRQNQTAP